MQDCSRGSSSARLLWLVNVCLFIASLSVYHAVYLLFVLRCVWNCSINLVNRQSRRRLSVFSLNGLKLMEHRAPNMEGFSYRRVDRWPAAEPLTTARWCYWAWRQAPPDAPAQSCVKLETGRELQTGSSASTFKAKAQKVSTNEVYVYNMYTSPKVVQVICPAISIPKK